MTNRQDVRALPEPYQALHAALRGFTTDQVAIVANVARYYRKATPDDADADASLAQLSASQKDIVRRLTAILRIADALDRGRRGAIRDVGVEVSDGEVRFRLRGRGDASLELESATKRAKYFRKVFETDVDFEETSAA